MQYHIAQPIDWHWLLLVAVYAGLLFVLLDRHVLRLLGCILGVAGVGAMWWGGLACAALAANF